MENAVNRIADDIAPSGVSLPEVRLPAGPMPSASTLGPTMKPSLRLPVEVPRSSASPPLALQRVGTVTGPRWPTALWCRGLRGLIQRSLIFPLLKVTLPLRVSGLHNLDGLDSPAIFAANHAHPADHLLILQALPRALRGRMAIAAAAEQLGTRGRGLVYPLVGNGFPLAQNGPIRSSLANVGRVLGDGWSVLIFPEGKLEKGGPTQPFKGGVGFCASGTGAEVVPVRLHVRSFGFPWFLPVLKRGKIEVVFGKPLWFPKGTSHRVATSAIEQAVATL